MSQEGQKFPLRKRKTDPDELRLRSLTPESEQQRGETLLTVPLLLAAQTF
jgi:hypothetical protein